ncbi:putative isomerase YddE [Streptomyces sp. RB5]|uniref:Putative isomerase YddE n=1 Tax=Streptomyces smaragdinus TaxID=2585196 RepID=A0A7K0CJY2_9ACTN|nr:PhzF family phenazine biosynthesis isomerase [Streptomyces smaragdinus]MQY13701.1 putative isomerase YddE [Streptomyces smaragdinus]
MTNVLRYTAFSTDPAGGNPAGVVLDASGLSDEAMLAVAAEVGYSETAFLTPAPDGAARSYRVRYFSPVAEVDFCGHATVATGVVLGERFGPGEYVLHANPGEVPVSVTERDGTLRATLTSVEPHLRDIAPEDTAEALAALGWSADELDPAFPPRVAHAGVNHLVLAARTRERLADLDYDFGRLRALMERLGLTTVQLVWRESAEIFHVRDPFPVGGVVEDPATGAAAAALGAYLRELGLVPEAVRLVLRQGDDMGRPSLLEVELRAGDPRVRVSGAATAL